MIARVRLTSTQESYGQPGQKLQAPFELDSDAFVAEVKKLRGRGNPLTAAGLKSLRDEYAATIAPARALAAEAQALEHRLSDLVNAAYALTPAEIALLWQTAGKPPPRGCRLTLAQALKPNAHSPSLNQQLPARIQRLYRGRLA